MPSVLIVTDESVVSGRLIVIGVTEAYTVPERGVAGKRGAPVVVGNNEVEAEAAILVALSRKLLGGIIVNALNVGNYLHTYVAVQVNVILIIIKHSGVVCLFGITGSKQSRLITEGNGSALHLIVLFQIGVNVEDSLGIVLLTRSVEIAPEIGVRTGALYRYGRTVVQGLGNVGNVVTVCRLFEGSIEINNRIPLHLRNERAFLLEVVGLACDDLLTDESNAVFVVSPVVAYLSPAIGSLLALIFIRNGSGVYRHIVDVQAAPVRAGSSLIQVGSSGSNGEFCGREIIVEVLNAVHRKALEVRGLDNGADLCSLVAVDINRSAVICPIVCNRKSGILGRGELSNLNRVSVGILGIIVHNERAVALHNNVSEISEAGIGTGCGASVSGSTCLAVTEAIPSPLENVHLGGLGALVSLQGNGTDHRGSHLVIKEVSIQVNVLGGRILMIDRQNASALVDGSGSYGQTVRKAARAGSEYSAALSEGPRGSGNHVGIVSGKIVVVLIVDNRTRSKRSDGLIVTLIGGVLVEVHTEEQSVSGLGQVVSKSTCKEIVCSILNAVRTVCGVDVEVVDVHTLVNILVVSHKRSDHTGIDNAGSQLRKICVSDHIGTNVYTVNVIECCVDTELTYDLEIVVLIGIKRSKRLLVYAGSVVSVARNNERHRETVGSSLAVPVVLAHKEKVGAVVDSAVNLVGNLDNEVLTCRRTAGSQLNKCVAVSLEPLDLFSNVMDSTVFALEGVSLRSKSQISSSIERGKSHAGLSQIGIVEVKTFKVMTVEEFTAL